jgi:pimeloyl-ACP methyl ester carboxylesterase
LLWTGLGLLVFPFLLLHGCAVAMDRGHAMTGLAVVQRTLETNGLVLRWTERLGSRGDQPVILVHGTPGSSSDWRAQFRNPPPGVSLYAIDRPGFHGAKPALAEPHLEVQERAVLELARYVSDQKVILIGHSYGGPVVLLAALEHPEKVAGVVLVGGCVDPDQEALWWIQHPFHYRALSWTIPQALRQSNREIFTLKDDLIALQQKLADLKVPVVMVHGTEDSLVPFENVAYLEAQLTAVGKGDLFTKQVHPGWNHFIPWEHPEAITGALGELEARLASGSPAHEPSR